MNYTAKIEELENQIALLKAEIEKEKSAYTRSFERRMLIDCMTSQRELDFLFPAKYRELWRRNVHCANDYKPIRDAAMICVEDHSYIDTRDSLIDTRKAPLSHRLRDLDDNQFKFVIECADEISKVIARKKIEYMNTLERTEVNETVDLYQAN